MAASPVIKKQRSISIVWLIPFVAVIIGGWLAYKAVTEKGPEINISFSSAAGLEAGKTKIKYKDVEVGVVEAIEIGEDLSGVNLVVQMKKGTGPYLTEKTQFWIVRARIGAGQVSGLDTLLGGAYIGIEPSTEGKPKASFTGLNTPPIVTSEMVGKRFVLNAERLGSLSPGAPIYFRQLQVGQVVAYELDEKGDNIGVNIFIESPYDKFVRSNTRFWVSSGLDLQLTADGLNIDTESFVSLMIGGISFNTFSYDESKPAADENSEFKLYQNRGEALDDRYRSDEDFYVEFEDSVLGLSVGAPLKFRGFRVGSVVDIELKANLETFDFSTMVRINFEEKRIALPTQVTNQEFKKRITDFVNRGLRAQLRTGSLLTGQLFVNLEIHDDLPPPKTIENYNELLVIPSLPSPTEDIMKGVASIVKKMDQLPLEEIGSDLQGTTAGINKLVNSSKLQNTVHTLNEILKDLKVTTKTLNSHTVPQANKNIIEMEKLIKDMDSWVDEDSPLYDDLRKTLDELSRAAQSISDLADMLERHPEALIQGKNNEVR